MRRKKICNRCWSVGCDASDRGGRPRRYVKVTPEGQALLAASRSTLMALWTGIEGALDR